MRALSLVLAFSAWPLMAAFDPAPWQFRAQIHVLERGRLAVFPFDRALYSRMRPDLADLRIVRQEGGEEAPYIIETVEGSIEELTCSPAILDRSATAEPAVRLTLDLAACPGGRRHSRVLLSTAESNFRQRVRIETSDDNRYWAVARDDAYIFDFTQGDRKLSALTVDYPVSTRRYTRVTVFGWSNPGAIAGASAAFRAERPAEYYNIDAVAPERVEDLETRTSLLTLDLGQAGLPHSRVRLEVDSPAFHRGVEIESSADRLKWTRVAQGTIFRVATEESVALSFPQRHDRYLRLRIFNGDNRPVPAPRVYVETPRRLVKFMAPGGGAYWLYYGNPSARAPVYDLAMTLSRQEPPLETAPMVQQWESNPGYVPPEEPSKPWSERYPQALYTALGFAVIIMGVVTVRFLRKVRAG
jgi:hypothetical protein